MQHLWPCGKVYPSQQASSPAKYLLPALLSPKQQQPPLLFGGIKSSLNKAMCHRNGSMEMKWVLFRITATFWQTSCPGLLAGSEQLQTPHWGNQELASWARTQNPPGFREGQTHPRKHGYKAASEYKMFWSLFCYPKQQDIVARLFWTLQSLCSLGRTKELCAEMFKGIQRALRWLYGASWTQTVLVLSPFLNKLEVQCNVKMRKTQDSP